MGGVVYAIPQSLQYAINRGVCLFIANIGMEDGHLFDFCSNKVRKFAGKRTSCFLVIYVTNHCTEVFDE